VVRRPKNTSGAKILSISTCGNKTKFDTAITVYSGTTCDSLLCVGGRDDEWGVQLDFTNPPYHRKTTPGQSYFILIHGSQAEDSGDFEMPCDRDRTVGWRDEPRQVDSNDASFVKHSMFRVVTICWAFAAADPLALEMS
jgi:hypothetical protein